MSKDNEVDETKVAEMRRLMQQGGDDAVTRRYGAGATNSQEFQTAQRQREMVRRRAEQARLEAAAQARDRQDAARKQQSNKSEATARQDRMRSEVQRQRERSKDTARTR
ncbi:hypothetical protein PQI66_08100 [Corynebacterium sp. USCH3]|uniref:hypothetical protein n=1 Tax=Corynebacterium sp. USCH3 TaxID=3024840 RepID=UPI0030A8773C